MKKVITYGTFDMLHYGHIKLLERAKELGDYLIVAVTSDYYDKTRGKINNQQSLTERIANVKKTGLADLIIIEEYEGQKIDDIKKYNIDIFTVGSDWEGKFDYLNEYCSVIYLPRTKGISSTEIRSKKRSITMGLIGNDLNYLKKYKEEDKYVNGIEIIGLCTNELEEFPSTLKKLKIINSNYKELMNKVDSVFIKTEIKNHYKYIKYALENKKHVLVESPIALTKKECKELFSIAKKNKCILMESIRTAYSTAYERLLLLIKCGKIGKVLSVDAVCTSLKDCDNRKSLYEWGPNALLPVLQILGTKYNKKDIISYTSKGDAFTRINFLYDNACASITVAEGAKSEGHLIITGTQGYIYVPSPWWKTDYFEIRYENQNDNKRYFYQLDGEGIRYELVAFCTNIANNTNKTIYITKEISEEICSIIDSFNNRKNFYNLI